jgi:hypothetical protein
VCGVCIWVCATWTCHVRAAGAAVRRAHRAVLLTVVHYSSLLSDLLTSNETMAHGYTVNRSDRTGIEFGFPTFGSALDAPRDAGLAPLSSVVCAPHLYLSRRTSPGESDTDSDGLSIACRTRAWRYGSCGASSRGRGQRCEMAHSTHIHSLVYGTDHPPRLASEAA